MIFRESNNADEIREASDPVSNSAFIFLPATVMGTVGSSTRFDSCSKILISGWFHLRKLAWVISKKPLKVIPEQVTWHIAKVRYHVVTSHVCICSV